jgi:putative membrane protein
MQRRSVIAGLTAALALPALGQTTSAALNQAAMPPGLDSDHMLNTMRVGATALVTSRIALDKARNEDVRHFAQLEVAEQETMSDVLTSMRDGEARPTGKLRAPATAVVNGNLDAKGRTLMQKLEQTDAGMGFDREYLRGQLDGHRELLQIQENFLARGGPREQINAAKLARATIMEHIGHLEALQARLG